MTGPSASRRRGAAAAAIAALALAACAGPFGGREPAVRPSVDTPAAWTQPASAAGTPGAVYPGAGWWTAFGSPELEALVAAAQRNNPDLAAARTRIAQATAQARVARAALYPSLGGSADASRSWRGQAAGADSLGVGLDASYEVDLWGVNRLDAQAASASRIATVFDAQAAAISLVAEVATTYFQALSLQDRLTIARQVLANAERILALVETQARAGAVSGLEIAQQRGAVAGLRASIPGLEQQRDQTLNALAALVGVPPGSLSVAAPSLAGLRLPTVAAGLPSSLLERRPDLRSAEASLTAARLDAEAARRALFPSIRLTAGSGYASDALASLFDPVGLASSLAAGLTAPILDAGQLAGQHDAAAARAAEAAEAYRAAVLAAFQDVEDALAAVRYQAQVEEAERAAAAEAQRAFELATIQYRGGSVDLLTLLDAQRSLVQQFDSLYQTRFGRLTAAIDLFRALGGGW